MSVVLPTEGPPVITIRIRTPVESLAPHAFRAIMNFKEKSIYAQGFAMVQTPLFAGDFSKH
jgi:hypothetical protein